MVLPRPRGDEVATGVILVAQWPHLASSSSSGLGRLLILGRRFFILALTTMVSGVRDMLDLIWDWLGCQGVCPSPSPLLCRP